MKFAVNLKHVPVLELNYITKLTRLFINGSICHDAEHALFAQRALCS